MLERVSWATLYFVKAIMIINAAIIKIIGTRGKFKLKFGSYKNFKGLESTLIMGKNVKQLNPLKPFRKAEISPEENFLKESPRAPRFPIHYRIK